MRELGCYVADNPLVDVTSRALTDIEDDLDADGDRLPRMPDISGQETMAAYDHYFDAARHADLQDQLHERLRLALEQGLKHSSPRAAPKPANPVPPPTADPDLLSLRGLGGANA